MVTIVSLPPLRITAQTVFLRRQCRSAGTSLIGVPQRVSSGVKGWQVELSVQLDWEQSATKRFEAFISSLTCDTVIAVPVYDAWGYDDARSPRQQPWADGTWFSDGTGWVVAGTSPLITTSAVQPDGDTVYVRLTDPVVPSLEVGDYFSVNGWLHHVTARTAAGWVKFAPSARAAWPVDTVLNTAPAVIYALPEGQDFGLRGRGLGNIAPAITLRFTEAFDR